MNQVCKIAKSLLNGEAISILTGFQKFFITNVPREIGRSIERKFMVKIEKKQKNFINADGENGYYFEYRLLYTPENLPGIERMKEYISERTQNEFNPKVKRGPKTIHVKATEANTVSDPPKSAFIQATIFDLSPVTASWDSPIN